MWVMLAPICMVIETIMGVNLACLSSLKLRVMHYLGCHKCPNLVASIVEKMNIGYEFLEKEISDIVGAHMNIWL